MSEELPVTTILKIKYKKGCKQECLQWMIETASIASAFDGFVEKQILLSEETEELVNIFTFKNNQSLLEWENSSQRFQQTEKSKFFVDEISSKKQLAGLEFMFPSAKAPNRWKMVLITVVVIFIFLNTLVPVLQQFFTLLHLPSLLKSLLGVVVMVCLMTYFILPFLSKVLRRWLNGG